MFSRCILITILGLHVVLGTRLLAQVTGDHVTSLPPHSLFGWAVSIHGEFAAISAPGENHGEMNASGAVYVYHQRHGEWKFFQRIIPADPGMMKLFGTSIKLQDNRLLVGAPGDNAKTGAVYVYTYDGASWIEERKLTPRNGVIFQKFGTHVDMGYGIVLVGSAASGRSDSTTGCVTILTLSTTSWEESTVYTPLEQSNDLFGASAVVVSRDEILVGAPRANGSIPHCGAVYSFRRQGDTWKSDQVLESSQPKSDGLFGCSLGYSAGRILVGAMQEVVDSVNSGVAYTFLRSDAGLWTRECRIVPDTLRHQDYFGMSVSLNGHLAFIGAPKWEEGRLRGNVDMGRVLAFTFSEGEWKSLGGIMPIDGRDDDHFGMAIASNENSVLIGARLHDKVEFNDGAAYFYKADEIFPELSNSIIPATYTLGQNYPNPFSTNTVIRYDLPDRAYVSIAIFDVYGREVRTLMAGMQEAGRWHVFWNGRDNLFGAVPSGAYIYRLSTPNFSGTRKLMLLR